MKLFKANALFPVTVLLGSFLLFQIQPVTGKYFLPWFGGAPAVWLTCLMFFQLLLLAGYLYAHFLQRVRPGYQAAIHLGLLTLALIASGAQAFSWGVPVLPDPGGWRPSGAEHPTMHVLQLLLISMGLSYFLLSAGASLMQAWFHRVRPDRSPYVLYVVSNAASVAALLSYPFLIEPHLALHRQAWLWSGGLAVYVLLCAGCVSKVWKIPSQAAEPAAPYALQTSRAVLWTLLSFCGVLALMAVTNQMTQDIPPVPFLWILPLLIYLISFIVGFMEKQRGWQDGYIYLLLCAFCASWYLAKEGLELEIKHQIAAYSFILLAICLFCHNALYRTRPDPKHLTGFYLCISLGGALGGLFVVLAAPVLFKGYWEYPLVLILSGVAAVFFIYTDAETRKTFHSLRHAFAVALIAFAVFLGNGIVKQLRSSIYMERNFFGSIRVALEYNNGIPIYSLLHGRINHGIQIHHPKFLHRTTTYYTESGGGGLALLNHPKRLNGEPMQVGFVGMGIGVMAAYGRPGDIYRFYEIDPAVIRLATQSPWFTFVKESKADCKIIEGDGRISLEREARPSAQKKSLHDFAIPFGHCRTFVRPLSRCSGVTNDSVKNRQLRGISCSVTGICSVSGFDVLVVDAFSGDHIPVHLLTLEAFELYRDRLAPDGVIAVNISNRYLDLLPVLAQVSKELHLPMAYIRSTGDMKISANAEWVLLSRNEQFLKQSAIARADSFDAPAVKRIRPWTDEFSNLLDVLK